MEIFSQQNRSFIFFSQIPNHNDYLDTSIILIAILVLALFKYIFPYAFSKNMLINGHLGLDAVPGPNPFPIAFIGNVWELIPIRESLGTLSRWSDKYPSCFKVIGGHQNFVVLNTAPLIQTLLKSSNFNHVLKSPLVYDLMQPHITNGVLVSSGNFWKSQRKILMRTMSYSSLRAYMTLLNRHNQRFVGSLESLFKDGQTHTINDCINASFLEVICEMITGVDIHGSAEGVEYHHNFQKWKECIVYRIVYVWFLFYPLWRLHPMAKQQKNAIDSMHTFANRRIEDHKRKRSQTRNPGAFRTMLDELVDEGVSDKQIVDEVNTMLFGGHETTASTTHFFCFLMASNPNIQKLCQKEVDSVFKDPFQFTNGNLTFEALANLKYLERCLLETLRMFPSVFLFLRKIEDPLILEIDNENVELPVGTNVAVCPWILHRKPEYFPNPEQFNPDRFIPEECEKRPFHAFLPFSAGPRNCLGLKFAMMQLKTVAAYIIHNFELSTDDELEDIRMLPNLTLTPERDFTFLFKKRHH